MKRLMVMAAMLAVLGACTGLGRLAKCTFDCAYPDEPDAGVPEGAPCAKKTAK